MFDKSLIDEFQQKINSANTVALFWHHGLDADAIGSVLWLCGILEKLGKQVSCFSTVPPTKSYLFVEWIEKIRTDFDYAHYDLIIFLDFTWYRRIGGLTAWHEEYFDNANIVVVDHHIDDIWDETLHALRLKDANASSNCELLLEIVEVLRPDLIDETIATHWYMWLLADTWNFQYQQHSLRTFGNAQKLIWYGAKKDLLIEKLFNSNPPALLAFMKLVTPRIQFTDKVASIRYSQEEIEALGMDFEEVSAFMFIIRSIRWFAVFAEIKILQDMFKISLRSGYTDHGRADVQKIAKTLNGWGHMYAAGCVYPYSSELAIEEQISTIIDHLDAETAKQL